MWVKIFIINWVLNILLIEFMAIRKLKKIITVDEARDSKYQAFRRLDTDYFSRKWLYMTCHFAFAKVFLSFFIVLAGGLVQTSVTIGLEEGKPMVGFRYFMMRVVNYIMAKILLVTSASCIWVYQEKPFFCYKKYLGP